MRIGFILIIICILVYALWVNWRLIKGRIDKMIFIGLALINLSVFYVYLLQKKLSMPMHGVFNQLVHYTMAMMGVSDHG